MKLFDLAQVMVGAGLGGGLRYALGAWMVQRWGSSFPWHTLLINVTGSFLLGLLMAVSAERGLVSPSLRIFLGVGILGGFTTFSTLSFESLDLMQRGLVGQGAANLFGSAVLGLAAAALGMMAGRLV